MIYTGTITDAGIGAGVYEVSFTPTMAGNFNLHVQFNGLEVDQSPY